MNKMKKENVIGRRLRAAREITEYSQKQLGIAAGIDQFSASPRMNHYEQGRHQPDYQTVCRLAELLKIPSAYIYADEDDLADVILAYSALSKKKRKDVLAYINALGDE